MKKLLLVLMAVLLLCGCASQTQENVITTVQTTEVTTEPEETTEPNGLTALITDEPVGQMMLESYSLSKLRGFFGEFESFYTVDAQGEEITLAQMWEKFPEFCFRDDYLILSVEEGGFYYVFWEQWGAEKVGDEIDLNEAVVEHTVYAPRICSPQDVESIVVDKSTYEDVKAIDPTVELQPGYTSFGGYYSRGHVCYSFILFKDSTALFIGYEYKDDSKETLVVKELEHITQSYDPGWWLAVDQADWPLQDQFVITDYDYEAEYQAWLEQVNNPIDGEGMIPLLFTYAKYDKYSTYLIGAGNNGEFYIADRFAYNGKSLYIPREEIYGCDYQKGPYNTKILDTERPVVFTDFGGSTVKTTVTGLNSDFMSIIEFLQMKPQLEQQLPETSRFYLGTYEGVEMFPRDAACIDNYIQVDLDGDGTEDLVYLALFEDHYGEEPNFDYAGYYYAYKLNITRNGKTYTFLPYASYDRAAQGDTRVFVADVDQDGEYEVLMYRMTYHRFDGLTIYDFNGQQYEKEYYTISPQN